MVSDRGSKCTSGWRAGETCKFQIVASTYILVVYLELGARCLPSCSTLFAIHGTQLSIEDEDG